MEELDLKEIFNMFWTRRLQIILIIVILLTIGLIYSYILLVPKYQSTTSILLAKTNTSQGGTTDTITSTDITLNKNLISTYSALLKTDSVLTQVINNLRLTKTTKELEESILVSAKEDTEIIEIKVVDEDAQLAQRVANEVAQVFITRIAQEYYNMDNVYVVDQAKVEVEPYNINHTKDLVVFAGVGIIISVIYVLIANMLDITVKSKEDIERKLGLTVLTSIPMCDFKMPVKGGKK